MLLFILPATQARTPYSTTDGSEPLFVVSEGRSQPTISSILWEAKIRRTENKMIGRTITEIIKYFIGQGSQYTRTVLHTGAAPFQPDNLEKAKLLGIILTEECKVGGRVANELDEWFPHDL